MTAIKVPLFWNGVAPAKRPSGFDPNPSDPAYYWTQLDTQLRLIRSHGLEPIVYSPAPRRGRSARSTAPRGRSRRSTGFARQPSGATPDLPRPPARPFLAGVERAEQGREPLAKTGVEDWYRALVNGFASASTASPATR